MSSEQRIRALCTIARFMWGARPNHGKVVALDHMLRRRRAR